MLEGLRVRNCALSLACALWLSVPGWSQTVTAGIQGTVSDSTGAVVPNAQVTALNEGTSFSRRVETDASGRYALTQLPLGVYTLTVQQAGFKAYSSSGIRLTANQVAGINPTLSLGEVTETVQVTAAAPIDFDENVTVEQKREEIKPQKTHLVPQPSDLLRL